MTFSRYCYHSIINDTSKEMCVTIRLRCQQPTEMSTISSYDKIATKTKYNYNVCKELLCRMANDLGKGRNLETLNFSNISNINFSYKGI